MRKIEILKYMMNNNDIDEYNFININDIKLYNKNRKLICENIIVKHDGFNDIGVNSNLVSYSYMLKDKNGRYSYVKWYGEDWYDNDEINFEYEFEIKNHKDIVRVIDELNVIKIENKYEYNYNDFLKYKELRSDMLFYCIYKKNNNEMLMFLDVLNNKLIKKTIRLK